MDSISDVINKYTGVSDDDLYERRVGVTCKVSRLAMVRLEAIAAHFEVKKTPLAGELLEGAINEVFEQVSGSFDENVAMFYEHELSELSENQ